MKTGKLSLSVGFSVVNAGQRNVEHEPELIAVSTPGSFRLTPAVSKALFIQHGDFIMFVNNIAQIQQAIDEKVPQLVAFCEENGLDIESAEAAQMIHAELDQWGIAKGIAMRDSKGSLLTTRERISKVQKRRYVDANFAELLEAARQSKDEDFLAAINREGATEEELKEILVETVQGDEVAKMKGSKLASPSCTTGLGVTLNFTDSNVWNQLKADLGETADKVNKVFAIDLDNIVEDTFFDGYENVKIRIALLGESRTEEPSRIAK